MKQEKENFIQPRSHNRGNIQIYTRGGCVVDKAGVMLCGRCYASEMQR